MNKKSKTLLNFKCVGKFRSGDTEEFFSYMKNGKQEKNKNIVEKQKLVKR